ncbi:MAG: hypothetical protein OEZ06_18650 [Myxococcales bacterium]|nr:hypothetical protein [Myxococcales bacterium]
MNRSAPRPRVPGRLALWLYLGAASIGCAAPLTDTQTGDGTLPSGPSPVGHPGPEAGQTRELTSGERRVIDELAAIAERVRGLKFVRKVPVLVQDSDAIMGYVDTQIDAEELSRAQTIYQALGLLEADLDVRALLLRLMGEQIVGYYDAEGGQLVVRDDVMRAFGRDHEEGPQGAEAELAESRIVLIHELVHALQDQHLGLSQAIETERDTDGDNAFRALVEGDATLAMVAFALEREAVPLSQVTAGVDLSELVRTTPLAGSELNRAPPIVREPLLFSYVEGLGFAARLHGDGQWKRLDDAHRTPPESTEQILHPERYLAGEHPEEPRLPDAATLLGEDFELLHEDTLGELEIRVYFAIGGRSRARAAANGWGGDRLYAYKGPQERTAIAWLTSWDSEADADQAEAAARRIAAGDPQQRVLRQGRALLLLRQVPPALQERVARTFRELSAPQWQKPPTGAQSQTTDSPRGMPRLLRAMRPAIERSLPAW